jgi:hypothetical protein
MRGVFIRKIKDFDEDMKENLENKTLVERLHGARMQPILTSR